MVDMNQTSTPPPAAAPPHQDLDRLRRSVTDRYVAGVAGGIGRHFGIDPTVVRVLFVVLTFFGGSGVLVYAVCWLFVPEDGRTHGTIHVNSEPRKVLILAAVGIAFLLAVGDAFSGFNVGWMIASLAVILALVMIARDRRDDRRAAKAAPTWGAAPLASDGSVPADPAPAASTGYPSSTAVVDPPYASVTPPPAPPTPPAPPAWQPPQPPLIPPRPKRTGVIWFWPTLALIAIGLGTVGIIDANHDVAPAAYPMVALAISGVMLLVGSVVGRPGGLIFLGFVSTFFLSAATVVGGFHLSGQSLKAAPQTAADVEPTYEIQNGEMRIDLSQLSDPENLAGREIDLEIKAGEVVVIVPRELNVTVDAEFDFAGGIEIPGYEGGGVQDSVTRNIAGFPANTRPALDLEIDATVGHIQVEQR